VEQQQKKADKLAQELINLKVRHIDLNRYSQFLDLPLRTIGNLPWRDLSRASERNSPRPSIVSSDTAKVALL
jgi:hypothetical protein